MNVAVLRANVCMFLYPMLLGWISVILTIVLCVLTTNGEEQQQLQQQQQQQQRKRRKFSWKKII